MVGTGVVLVAGSTSACLPIAGDDEGPSDSIDPDRRRVEEMAAQIAELQALLTATVLVHPGLATRLAALRACHTAHHRVLVADADADADPSSTPSPSDGPTPAPSTDSAVPTSPRAALTRLRTSEQAHASALAASATMSQSGALARLFAVMAAGVEQHLGVLTEAGAS